MNKINITEEVDKNKEEKTNSNDTDRYIEVRDFIQEIYEGSGGADPITATVFPLNRSGGMGWT